jgi:hypothetical protein
MRQRDGQVKANMVALPFHLSVGRLQRGTRFDSSLQVSVHRHPYST